MRLRDRLQREGNATGENAGIGDLAPGGECAREARCFKDQPEPEAENAGHYKLCEGDRERPSEIVDEKAHAQNLQRTEEGRDNDESVDLIDAAKLVDAEHERSAERHAEASQTVGWTLPRLATTVSTGTITT
jgi:hypothetical protein